MSKFGRQATRLLASAALMGVACASASACSCVDGGGGTSQVRFDKAADVVKGRVTEVTLGDTAMQNERPFVRAKLKVSETLKGGKVGAVSFVTGFGDGDCGLLGALVSAVANRSELTLELRRVPKPPGDYEVSYCGYWKLDDASAAQLPVSTDGSERR